MLYKFELQLDRLNEKVKRVQGSIQKLEVKKNLLANQGVLKKYKEMERQATAIGGKPSLRELLTTERILTQAHTDGFNLGMAHGKFQQGLIERSLLLAQGQINGVKHGWISGFEAG